jgi:hypothetical protein
VLLGKLSVGICHCDEFSGGGNARQSLVILRPTARGGTEDCEETAIYRLKYLGRLDRYVGEVSKEAAYDGISDKIQDNLKTRAVTWVRDKVATGKEGRDELERARATICS